jgi:glutamate dehydrogenase (NAD(P)+)
MAEVFRLGDDPGPVRVIHVREPRLGLQAVLVVDNVARGPSIGGLRMAPDVSTAECFRPARAMTLKNSAAGLAHGGGKSVLWGDPAMPLARKEALIRAFAHALRNERDYIFGPDMGTDETCMARVQDAIGRAVGLPAALGGIPLDEIGATGWGLSHAAEVATRHLGFSLERARVAIQGFGRMSSARTTSAESRRNSCCRARTSRSPFWRRGSSTSAGCSSCPTSSPTPAA